MTITVSEADALAVDWIDNPALVAHVRAVGIVMRALALHYDEDPEEWQVAGILHDADYDRWPEEHPNRIVKHLRDRGEDALAHAISAHHTGWGVPYESLLDRALLAADEITGFVVAVARVRPGGLQELTAKSVRKKLKTKSFAAGVERSEVEAGVRLLEVDLNEHIEFVIAALRPHEAEVMGSGAAGGPTSS